MYREHENPYCLEDMLKERRRAYDRAVADGASDEIIIELAEDIADLEERVNFAWQDYEY